MRSMDRLLRHFLSRFIRRGSITFTTSNGAAFTCGDGTGQPVSVRFLTAEAERHLLLDPELAIGEIYTDGEFIVENGSIADLLAVALDQPDMLPRWSKVRWWLRYLIRHWQQFNPRKRAKQNVASHYDLDGRLYRLFSTWTCNTAARISRRRIPLDDAQLAKRRPAAKLLVRPDHRVLDIVPGGLAILQKWRAQRSPASLVRRTARRIERARTTETRQPRRSFAGLSRHARSLGTVWSARSSMWASIIMIHISIAAPSC